MLWNQPILVAFDLADGHFPVTPMGGQGWSVDIQSLHLGSTGYDGTSGDRSGLVVFEDGKLLAGQSSDAEIMGSPGHFRRAGERLLLSTSDAANPLTNGRHYLIVTNLAADIAAGLDRRDDELQWKRGADHQTFLMLMGGVLVLLAAGALAVDAGWRRWSGRYPVLAAILVLVPVAAGLLIDAHSHRHDLKFSADTMSYEMKPGHTSYRTPGYWAFARLVLGRHWTPATNGELPAEQTAPPGLSRSPLIRLVHAQQWLAIACVLALGMALTWLMPPPFAAALAMLIGNFCSAVPWASTRVVELFYLFSFALAGLLMLWQRVPRTPWQPWLVSLVGACALAIPTIGLLQFGFPAAMVDWVISDSVASSLGMLFLASILGVVYQRSRWWLLISAVLAGAVYLVRPPDIVDWLVVCGLAPIAIVRLGWRRVRLPLSLILAVFVTLVLLPSLYLSRVSDLPTVPERHSLTFATIIADDADVALMPDDESRAYLKRVLPKMAEARQSDPRFQQELVMYFNLVAYDIAWPSVAKVAHLTHPSQRDAAARSIASRVSNAILLHHFGRYIQLIAQDVPSAIYYVRLGHIAPLWLISILVIGGCALVRNDRTFSAMLLLLAAFGSDILVLLTSIPFGRLLDPVDPLLCMAMLITGTECAREIVFKIPAARLEAAVRGMTRSPA